MKNLFLNLTSGLLFVLTAKLGQKKMLHMRVKKISMVVFWIVLLSSVLYVTPSFAADTGLFEDLKNKGIEIFEGMRDIIYVVAGFGIIGVAIGGFFGNINWKWLGAIVIGLMVIGLTGGILSYIGGSSAPEISDTLK